MIRRHLLTETIANAHEVRIQDYDGVRSKLVDLGADKPNDDCPKAGGVYRRELVSVPAIGLGSPRQNIPRGDAAKGAHKDRQFTDQNCKPESKEGKLHSIVRMRRRSCHFCKGCMRLDPCDDANGKQNPCQYEELCGPADNVVAVAREKDRTARVTRSASGANNHLERVKEAKVGSVVACHSKKEPEVWFLGEVVKEAHLPNATFIGGRGEKVAEGEWHLKIQKYLDVEGDDNFHTKLEGEEGELYVPVENVVTVGVVVLNSKSSEAECKEAMGTAEWDATPRSMGRKIKKRGGNNYLPALERERIWLNCPH